MNEEKYIKVETGDQACDAERISLVILFKEMSKLISENKIGSDEWCFYRRVIEIKLLFLEKKAKKEDE